MLTCFNLFFLCLNTIQSIKLWLYCNVLMSINCYLKKFFIFLGIMNKSTNLWILFFFFFLNLLFFLLLGWPRETSSTDLATEVKLSRKCSFTVWIDYTREIAFGMSVTVTIFAPSKICGWDSFNYKLSCAYDNCHRTDWEFRNIHVFFGEVIIK